MPLSFDFSPCILVCDYNDMLNLSQIKCQSTTANTHQTGRAKSDHGYWPEQITGARDAERLIIRLVI